MSNKPQVTVAELAKELRGQIDWIAVAIEENPDKEQMLLGEARFLASIASRLEALVLPEVPKGLTDDRIYEIADEQFGAGRKMLDQDIMQIVHAILRECQSHYRNYVELDEDQSLPSDWCKKLPSSGNYPWYDYASLTSEDMLKAGFRKVKVSEEKK